MSLITEEIIRKGYRAAETVGARHWGPKAFEIALTAVLPDILETAAKVAENATKGGRDAITTCCDCEQDCDRIARAIRALADTGTVQSSNLLKKKAK